MPLRHSLTHDSTFFLQKNDLMIWLRHDTAYNSKFLSVYHFKKCAFFQGVHADQILGRFGQNQREKERGKHEGWTERRLEENEKETGWPQHHFSKRCQRNAHCIQVLNNHPTNQENGHQENAFATPKVWRLLWVPQEGSLMHGDLNPIWIGTHPLEMTLVPNH